MKVSGSGTASAIAGRSAPRGEASDFAPPAAGPPTSAAPARAGGIGTVSSLEALLALQETLGPLERRRRAIRRAGALLDALDDLKLALVAGDGGADDAALTRLTLAARDTREHTEDAALEDLLEQVEIRAAVELAKSEVAATRHGFRQV